MLCIQMRKFPDSCTFSWINSTFLMHTSYYFWCIFWKVKKKKCYNHRNTSFVKWNHLKRSILYNSNVYVENRNIFFLCIIGIFLLERFLINRWESYSHCNFLNDIFWIFYFEEYSADFFILFHDFYFMIP